MSDRGSTHESEMQESSGDDSVNEQEVRQQIVLSPNQLREIGEDDDRFFEVVRDINDKAVAKILDNRFKTALIYLAEAERILEYGACCGKVIDRDLILCVLQNEATAYQRIWDLNKCSKYIQAVIYNLEESLKNQQSTSKLLQNSAINAADYEILCSVTKRKVSLVQYYLQFCAIMSQLKNHEVALSWSFKAISLMKELMFNFNTYLKDNMPSNENMMVLGKKLKILRELSCYKEDLVLSDYENLLARTKYVFKEWRNHRGAAATENEIQDWIRTYSIGNAMQMEASSYHDFSEPADFKAQLSMQSLIKKVLLFAIGYFTVATQIRLIEVEKYPLEEDKRKSEQFQRSQLYHLTAIKIFYTYVSYESMFVKHVLHSFRSHYRPELEVEDAPQVPDLQVLEKQPEQQHKPAPPQEQEQAIEQEASQAVAIGQHQTQKRSQLQEKSREIQPQIAQRPESEQDHVLVDNDNDQEDEGHIKPIHHPTQPLLLPPKKKKKKTNIHSETARPLTGRSTSRDNNKPIKGLGSPTARPKALQQTLSPKHGPTAKPPKHPETQTRKTPIKINGRAEMDSLEHKKSPTHHVSMRGRDSEYEARPSTARLKKPVPNSKHQTKKQKTEPSSRLKSNIKPLKGAKSPDEGPKAKKPKSKSKAVPKKH